MPEILANRSIPAWAGETRTAPPGFPLCRVYPRVGGGNRFNAGQISLVGGLSPRGRGKPNSAGTARGRARSIPAWAGETRAYGSERREPEVYPRVGGGNRHRSKAASLKRGLSPRGRGKRPGRFARRRPRRSIPAWAGETKSPAEPLCCRWVYPRVGGGNAWARGHGWAGAGLSPRGRGKRSQSPICPAERRSIPAWAGETR